MRRPNVAFVAVFVLLASPLGCKRASTPPVSAQGGPPARSPSPSLSEKRGEPSAGRLSAAVAAPAIVAVPAQALRAAQQRRVVVVGGGIAGLLAAYELEKRGLKIQVLEAESVFGGRVATAQYEGGATAEYGLQELWSENPLLGTARELGVALDDNPTNPYSSVVIDGKIHPYFRGSKEAYLATLMTPSDKAQFLAWLDEAQKLLELARAPGGGLKDERVQRLQSMSFGAWVESAKLPHNATELLRLLIECEVATNWHGFSALFGLLEFNVFLGNGQLASHVRGGNSRLIEALVQAIHGEKLLAAPVMRIERHKDESGRLRIRVDYRRDGQMYSTQADRVVVAVPFWRLHQIEMIPPLSEEKWLAVNSLIRGQYTVVHMLMPKEARKLYMIGPNTPFALLTDGPLGVVYGTGEQPSELPPRATEVFSLLIHGQAAAAFHMVPRQIRLQEIYARLDSLWPGFSSQIRASYVYTYHPASVPVWPPGRSPLDEPSARLREPELGLYLAGDYLENAHSDGAARAGIRAAERIAAEFPAMSEPQPMIRPAAPPARPKDLRRAPRH